MHFQDLRVFSFPFQFSTYMKVTGAGSRNLRCGLGESPFNAGTHGAVIFAVADHAWGVCGNSLGRKAVLVNFNISFFANPKPGSVIQAEARMTHVDEIRGSMVIDVRTSKGQALARCQAVIFFLNPDRSVSLDKQKGTAYGLDGQQKRL